MNSKRFLLAVLILGALVSSAWASASDIRGRADLAYYLPAGETYAENIPVPSEIIGHEVGEQHVSHDRLVEYMYKLAEVSERVQLQETGRTYEGRKLLLMAISSAENIANLDSIQAAHKAAVIQSKPVDGPLVVALGYSVHGNEASGSNASLLTAYHLAAAQSPEVADILEHTVILLDPSLNPDGLSRFAQWVNSHRGRQAVADSASREHREVWPGGRTNHYWFDLNRDWLPVQHPESKARITWFHQWRPHVLADFHEMGADQTFFFQPGVPSRTNPLTPESNINLTNALAAFHARALDSEKALYYSAEGYDDFYYGKGSTYPDIHGGIGILFEQASARGHLQESINGDLGFPFAIRNQFLTSMSTLQGAHALRDQFSEALNQFHRKALTAARKDSRGGFVFSSQGDRARTQAFIDVLTAHEIEVYSVGQTLKIDGAQFPAADLFLVPFEQPQYHLVRTLFETPTSFRDNTFYDVSAWTLPLAFGLPYRAVSRREAGQVRQERFTGFAQADRRHLVDENAYAWIINWQDYFAASVVNKVLGEGAQARVATRPFTLAGVSYPAGSVVVSAGHVPEGKLSKVRDILRAAGEQGVRVSSATTGLTESGIDFGSPNMEVLVAPRPAILIGSGVNGYEAGEVWHLLDHRYEVSVALLDKASFAHIDLNRYTHLLLVDGGYDSWSDGEKTALAAWVKEGGVLVAQRGAAAWVLAQEAFGLTSIESESASAKTSEESADPVQKSYAERDEWEASKVIGGAIFRTRLDTTHPLGFGFQSSDMPVFHRGVDWVAASKNPFENVAVYSKNPLIAGFSSVENIEAMSRSVSVRQSRVGQGNVILFSDIPAFRAFWYGSSRLWVNALFFGGNIDRISH